MRQHSVCKSSVDCCLSFLRQRPQACRVRVRVRVHADKRSPSVSHRWTVDFSLASAPRQTDSSVIFPLVAPVLHRTLLVVVRQRHHFNVKQRFSRTFLNWKTVIGHVLLKVSLARTTCFLKQVGASYSLRTNKPERVLVKTKPKRNNTPREGSHS